MKLVFITQQVDPAHPALGATVAKIAALAARVDEVVALADRALPDVLPANCRTRTFSAPVKAGRGVRFEAALARELPGLRGGAVVAHMCPIYAVLSAPLVRPVGVPVVLWFTHWRASVTLRLAERLSTAVASVDRRSFPLGSRKVRAIGHGIDLADFACTERPEPSSPLRVLALGRYSSAKGLDGVIRAVRLAVDRGAQVQLTAHGPTLTAGERRTREELGLLVSELGLDERVLLGPAVPRDEVARLLADADLVVNNMREGALDKVVYEAAASCVPVLASNAGFDQLLEPELRFARDRPAELADRLIAFAATDRGERAAIGRRLRERVEQSHSVEAWADGILAAAGLRRST